MLPSTLSMFMNRLYFYDFVWHDDFARLSKCEDSTRQVVILTMSVKHTQKKSMCSWQKGLFVYSSAFSQKDFFQLTENYHKKKISVKSYMRIKSPKGRN